MTIAFLLLIPAVLLSMVAAGRVKSTFARYAQVPSRRGLSGAEVARLLLRARGITGVRVERTGGQLSDHYDPREKVLRLSAATYDSPSVAAAGVAAHEAGHALQHADGYRALQFRSSVVPVVALGSRLLPFLILFAVLTGAFGRGGLVAWLAVAALAAVAVFTIATLPVEFNASSRALAVLQGGGILEADELDGARRVLNAAALTYVAAAVVAVLELAHWALLLFGGRADE